MLVQTQRCVCFVMPKKKKIKRFVSASGQVPAGLYIAPLPSDRAKCGCQGRVVSVKKGEKVTPYDCPRSKEDGMRPYLITCKNCGEKIAFIHATDEKLSDWCNLHYITKTDGKQWLGCMAVNISPIDERLGFECTCGQDTRDFRTNTRIPKHELDKLVEETSKGKAFDKRDSKFKVKEL